MQRGRMRTDVEVMQSAGRATNDDVAWHSYCVRRIRCEPGEKRRERKGEMFAGTLKI